MNEELRRFIKESLEQGIDRDTIRNVLLEAGWQERDVRSAMAAYADVDFPVAVPRPRPYLHAREAFLYLVSFIALYVFAFSLGAVLFGLIDHTFSDALDGYRSSPSTADATAIAAVIVAFPLYLILMRRLTAAVATDPERRQSLVRRWLTYLTLVVGAGIILGDIIALLASLLTGDPTVNFFLKVAAVVVVVATVGYSIYVVGTPGQQRDVRLDQERIEDLRSISRNIDTYLELNEEMPASLFDLLGPQYYVRSIEDPDTGAPYEYRIIDETDYELCAVFAAESPERRDERRPFSETIWDHGPGLTCFGLTAEAER